MGVFEDIMFIVHACWFQKVDKPARLTIVPDCQIIYKKQMVKRLHCLPKGVPKHLEAQNSVGSQS